ncbi:MAG: glycosyltransferase family protein [Bdellovibrionota bacterium]|nr:glycosyltransferase family protein [Bdellovibrionota bacterium]
MSNIVAIVQARTSSTRLPKKVLEPLGESCMLVEQIKRMQKAKTLSKIVVATSDDPSDDAIEELCKEHDFYYFRGDLNNVLSRYYYCAKEHKADVVVRVTGDCPLIDPILMDQIIEFHLKKHSEYTSNARPATYPDGLDVEVFSFLKLEDAFNNATLPSEKEHVSPYIFKNTKDFLNFENTEDFSKLRVTVDNKEDLEVVRAVFNELSKEENFGYQEIIQFLVNNPEISKLNSSYVRNEGSLKSLEEDKKFLSENN